MSQSVSRARRSAARPCLPQEGNADTAAAGGVSKSARTNADVYRDGERAAAARTRLSAGNRTKPTWRAAAAKVGLSAAEAREAAGVADAVDRIAVNCGERARELLLSDHPRLDARLVEQIARTHPDRQRFALAEAAAGRDPLGKPPPGVDPPFDTLGVGEIRSRLARNIGALDGVADGLLDTPAGRWPAADKLGAILGHATTIRRLVRRMTPRVTTRPSRRSAAWRGCRHVSPRFDPASALRTVAAVAGVAAKNDRDLDRALAETPPTASEKADLLDRLRALRAAADWLAAVVRARGHDVRTGPAEVPGTYVVVYHLPWALRGLRVGALGTFDFPAGYYAYVGSAFGGGGVGKRIGRHCNRRSKERWNVDYLKPHCTPVAVWWTHDRRRVEFAWAAALGAMPGASFPAPRFGAADNDAAAAHLVRFDRLPGAAEFRPAVAGRGQGHAAVLEAGVPG